MGYLRAPTHPNSQQLLWNAANTSSFVIKGQSDTFILASTNAGDLKWICEQLGWIECMFKDDSPFSQTTEPVFADEVMDIWKARSGGAHVKQASGK